MTIIIKPAFFMLLFMVMVCNICLADISIYVRTSKAIELTEVL